MPLGRSTREGRQAGARAGRSGDRGGAGETRRAKKKGAPGLTGVTEGAIETRPGILGGVTEGKRELTPGGEPTAGIRGVEVATGVAKEFIGTVAGGIAGGLAAPAGPEAALLAARAVKGATKVGLEKLGIGQTRPGIREEKETLLGAGGGVRPKGKPKAEKAIVAAPSPVEDTAAKELARRRRERAGGRRSTILAGRRIAEQQRAATLLG